MTPAEAQNLAGQYQGTWRIVDQAAILKSAAKFGLKSADRAGVCWEVCRRWIKARLTGTYSKTTLDDIISPRKADDMFAIDHEKLDELISAHAGRNTSMVMDNYKIDGLKEHWMHFRLPPTGTGFKSTGLNSRAAVLKVVLDGPGAYIYNFLSPEGGGHAVAFDTRKAPFRFIDPNTGEGKFPAQDKFSNFFREYYQQTYKKEYHGGKRELTRYSA